MTSLTRAFFRKDSGLGVAGLVEGLPERGASAWRNAIGTGVADDKVVYHFVPKMIRYYLGQDPILQNVPTYLASQPDDLKFILRASPRTRGGKRRTRAAATAC